MIRRFIFSIACFILIWMADSFKEAVSESKGFWKFVLKDE